MYWAAVAGRSRGARVVDAGEDEQAVVPCCSGLDVGVEAVAITSGRSAAADDGLVVSGGSAPRDYGRCPWRLDDLSSEPCAGATLDASRRCGRRARPAG